MFVPPRISRFSVFSNSLLFAFVPSHFPLFLPPFSFSPFMTLPIALNFSPCFSFPSPSPSFWPSLSSIQWWKQLLGYKAKDLSFKAKQGLKRVIKAMGSHPCIHFLLPRVPFLSLPAPSAPSFLFPFLFPPLLPRLSSFSFCGRWPCCRFSSGKLALLTLSNTDVLGRIALHSLGYPHSRVLQERMNRSSSIWDADAGGPKVRRRPRSPRKEVLLGHVLDTHKVKRWAIAIRVFMHRGYPAVTADVACL